LLGRSEIPKLMRHLKTGVALAQDPGPAKGWRHREIDKLKLSGSRSVFDLADVVESLTRLSDIKPLAFDERETLYRARKLLICEIAEVMNESKTAAEARIDSVLEAGKSKLDESPD
jgi:RNA polymerase-interacting CarD/CdnL/TRCF family regulator